MIQVNGLTKDYGLAKEDPRDIRTLRGARDTGQDLLNKPIRRGIFDLNFEVKQGEIVGFLGPNGAGKTTTMRILTGYMPPTSGEAIVAGYDVLEDSLEVRKRIGYMPERISEILYEDMTAVEYLKYMAELRHLPSPESRAYEILETVNLDERADSFIGTFSKGMRQRVGLAQALLHRPEVIILDEPTIGLDPAQVVEIRNVIREIGKDRTVLFSTHILSEAQQICDRVLIINKGLIVAEDTPENLHSRVLGTERVRLRVRGDADGLDAAVKKVKGTRKVSSNKVDAVEFEFSAGQDVRPQVAKAIVEGGYELIEMSPIGASLEDIFLELTEDKTTGKRSGGK